MIFFLGLGISNGGTVIVEEAKEENFTKKERAIVAVMLNTEFRDIREGLINAFKEEGVVYSQNEKNGFTFHDLRHIFNTNMRKEGVPDSVMMEITGHPTRKMFDRNGLIKASLYKCK